MIDSSKKIKRIAIEYDDGSVEMIKNPTGLFALLQDESENYKKLYHITDEDLQEDDEVNVEISNINCKEEDMYCCIDAIVELANDYGLISDKER